MTDAEKLEKIAKEVCSKDFPSSHCCAEYPGCKNWLKYKPLVKAVIASIRSQPVEEWVRRGTKETYKHGDCLADVVELQWLKEQK